jgi:hypothetical protein
LTPNISNQIRFEVGFVTRRLAETQQSQALFANAAIITQGVSWIIHAGKCGAPESNPQGYPQLDVSPPAAHL